MNAPIHREIPASALLDTGRALAGISAQWDGDIVRRLTDYIAIPAKSPSFDPDWVAHGHIETVVRQAADWVLAQKVPGLQLEIVRLQKPDGSPRTPVLFFEIAGTKPGSDQTALMYGHLDKQPEFNGWRNDLGPWTPKYEDGRLYGRGGADDGYAVYAAIAAVQALKAQDVPHPRIVGLIETCEESGSYDLLPYIDALRAPGNNRLGDVGLVVCLDSGAGNYDQLWLTTSLRGMASGTLKVEILTEGIHSGDASGLVPSSFRIMRQVLDRLEDSATGRLLPASFHCEVPANRLAQAQATAAILGEEVYKRFPWAHYDCGGSTTFALPTTTDPLQALLNRTWLPTLSVTGAEGFPVHPGCRQRAAPLDSLQAEPAPAPAGGRCGGRAGAEGAAGRQRALPGESHVRQRWRRHRLECAGGHAVVRDRPERGQPGPFRGILRLHRTGRHDSVDEHAQRGLPQGADDGLRRARTPQQRARSQ
jgi:acetylornithine deacetylase/succinyl-diaminopimelate desuccinylase-like protein